MEAKNVFIATLPRSGSTLLGMMLGAHSQVCHVGESAYWSKIDANTSRCCCGSIGCKTLIEMFKIISSHPQEIDSIEAACGMIDLIEEPKKLRHNLSHSAQILNPEAFEQTLQLCCNGLKIVTDAARIVSGKRIIIENSKYPAIAERLLKQDTSWKIIVVTRDPRGIACSSKEAGKRKSVPRPIEDKINLFLSFSQRISILTQNSTDVLLVRYEDLCRDTVKTLSGVCAFMGIAFEPEMTKFKTHKGHLLMGNHMMYDQNENVRENLVWHELLSSDEKDMFMRNELVSAYSQFGYNLETE